MSRRPLLLALILTPVCAAFPCLGADEPLAAGSDTVAVAAPGAVTTDQPVAINEIRIEGLWRAKITLPLPETTGDQLLPDPGLTPAAKPLVARHCEDQDWPEYRVPQQWEQYGGEWKHLDGEAVFRRTVGIPPAWAGRDLELYLGPIDDFDDTYINGELVGRIDKGTIGHWAVPRRYQIPGRLVEAGTMTIAVRIFDHFGSGGFTASDEPMHLRIAR